MFQVVIPTYPRGNFHIRYEEPTLNKAKTKCRDLVKNQAQQWAGILDTNLRDEAGQAELIYSYGK